MINLDNKSTPNFKQNVLISVNALIDLDIGLMSLIKEDYMDPSVFNEKFFSESDIIDIINTTYFRKDDNPLYAVSIIKDYQQLDEYYMEFMTNMYNTIFDKAVYTDIVKMIDLFIDTDEIDISILYYTDYAKEQMEKDQQEGKLNPNVTFIDSKTMRGKDLDKFGQIYLRSIFEFDALPIDDLTSPKTFYISTFMPNYNKDKSLKRTEVINKLMGATLRHDFTTFDLYNLKNIIRNKPEENNNVS